MKSANGVYTVGQVAKLMKVAPRTVTKWIDEGELTGYRINISRDRRVLKVNLVRFLRKYGLSMEGLEAGYQCAVLAGFPAAFTDALTPLLADWDVRTAPTLFSAGATLARSKAGVVALGAGALGGAGVREAGEAAVLLGAAVVVRLGDDNDATPWAKRGWAMLAADATPEAAAAVLRKAVGL
jgi:two-component system, OmpR family, response regulator RpaA